MNKRLPRLEDINDPKIQWPDYWKYPAISKVAMDAFTTTTSLKSYKRTFHIQEVLSLDLL